jgi:hypothetical protein
MNCVLTGYPAIENDNLVANAQAQGLDQFHPPYRRGERDQATRNGDGGRPSPWPALGSPAHPLRDDRIGRLRDQATGYADVVSRMAKEITDQGHTGAPEKVAELLTLKPTLWGMGVDLKELGRRCGFWLTRPLGK